MTERELTVTSTPFQAFHDKIPSINAAFIKFNNNMAAAQNCYLSFGFVVVTNELPQLEMWNLVQRYIINVPINFVGSFLLAY
jgi:hypothetical protein